ncbi:MAG: hypothetical protein QOJ39_3906 [Candidatus Eremiobacteraeota bacterium]|nr:hypothetical protein [Candidatus Eremiobacteraeota bacterium]
MNALAVLSFGDRRTLINTVRELRRHPGRLALWALYAIVILGFAFIKTKPSSQHSQAPPFFVTALNDLWLCGFAIAFGIVLATGTSRWLGVFSSRAEALVLTRAQTTPLLVAAYLQMRAVVVTLAQGFTRFAYLIVIGIPTGTTVFALLAQLLFFAAAGAAVASVALPRALARGRARIAMIAAGVAIAAAGAIPLALDALRVLQLPAAAALLRRAPDIHPGTVLIALAAGDLRCIAVPLAVAACATAAFALAARDAFPELYTISLANLEWRMRVRNRRGLRDDDAAKPSLKTVRSTAGTSLRGALAFLWVDALMFTRRISPVVTAVVAALALIGGAAFAAFARHSPELTFGILFGTLPGLAIAVASTTGVRLAPALRMPLFWLGDVSLAARLAAWTFGAFWRDAVLVALAVAGYAAVSGDIHGPLVVFAGASGLLALTRAVGLAVFALLPNQIDQRGPAVMLRAVLSFALVAPAVTIGAIAAVVFSSPFIAGTLTGTLAAFTEAALLIVFAAWRLAGRVDRLALA